MDTGLRRYDKTDKIVFIKIMKIIYLIYGKTVLRNYEGMIIYGKGE